MADLQDDVLTLLLDVGDADHTGWLRRGRAPELGRATSVRGFDQPLIENVCFENWLRVLGET
jgi:microsomal dipeptidase-like Zn-dependent dipeptidase